MPSDLFGTVTQPKTRAQSRGRSIAVLSIAVHAVAIGGALVFSLTSPGLLPQPREALAFIDTSPHVMPVDIELPSPAPSRPVDVDPGTAPASAAIEPSPVSANAAPVVAPTGIADESGAERAQPAARSSGLSGIEGGTGPLSELGIGRQERPAAPVAAPQTPVRLHSGIREPVKIVHVNPTYPPLAQNARVQGVVILEAVIGASGQVESVQVLKSIPLLDTAAVQAVRQWQYRPATLNGSPIAVIMTITVRFAL